VIKFTLATAIFCTLISVAHAYTLGEQAKFGYVVVAAYVKGAVAYVVMQKGASIVICSGSGVDFVCEAAK
jgi:hypothetical protein